MSLEQGVNGEISMYEEIIRRMRSDSLDILNKAGNRPQNDSRFVIIRALKKVFIPKDFAEFNSIHDTKLQRFTREILQSEFTPIVYLSAQNVRVSESSVNIMMSALDPEKEIYKKVITVNLPKHSNSPFDTKVILWSLVPLITGFRMCNFMQTDYKDLFYFVNSAIAYTNNYLSKPRAS